MLGYVMDGRIAAAEEAVDAAISRKARELRIQPPGKRHQAAIMPNEVRVTQTDHRVGESPFVIYHVFLNARNK